MNRHIRYYNDRFMYNVKYLSTVIKITIVFLFLKLPLAAGAETEPERFTVSFPDFLYVVDGGYEPYYSFEKNVERHIFMQTMEQEFAEQVNHPIHIEALPVLRGSMDYLKNSVAEDEEHQTYADYDLVIWGVVQPLVWPMDYNLVVYIFPNSLKYPAQIQDFSLRVRNNRIIQWDKQKCDLPETAMSAIPQIITLKYFRARLEKEENGALEELLSENLKKVPFDIRKSLLEGALDEQTAGRAVIGYLQLELDHDRHMILDLNSTTYKRLQPYLSSDQPLRWPLQQSSMIMPDIAIEGSREPEILPTERLVNTRFDYTTDKYMVGILPFTNNNPSPANDWIGYGIEYLLEYKLSGISDFRMLDNDLILQALSQRDTSSADSARIRIESGERTLGFNLGISGSYQISNDQILVDMNVINTLDGDTVSRKSYRETQSDLLNIPDQIVRELLKMTEIYSTTTEQRYLADRLTSSMDAYESFCRGRLESRKSEKHYERIIGYFNEAIAKDPQFWEAYHHLGVALFNSGQNEEAMKVFTMLIGLFPNYEKPLLERGRVYERLDQAAMAADDFKAAIRIAPSNYLGFFYLGRLHIAQKQYEQAVKMLQRAALLKPGSPEILYQLGNAYYGQHQYKKALPLFEKGLKNDSVNLIGMQKLGECYYHVHNFQAAKESFQKVLRILPDNPETNFMYGITVYKQAILDDFISAFLEMFKIDARIQPVKKKNEIDPAGDQARILREMIKRFKKAYLARDDFYEATFNLAMTYSELGRMDSAMIYYEKTVDINPESAKAHLMLAKTYEKRFQRQRALEKYKDVLKLEPSYFVNDPVLGKEYHNINLVELVVGELEAELKENPEDIEANLSLARIYYAQGFYGKAANLSRRVLAVNPENIKAKKILAQLGRF